MDGFKAMGTGARAAILAGGALIAGAAGYGIWSVSQGPAPVAVSATGQATSEAVEEVGTAPNGVAAPDLAADAPAAEPEAADEAAVEAADAAPATEPTAAVAPEVQTTEAAPPEDVAPEDVAQGNQPLVPSFDLVRVEPDGQALVAGQAEPGSKIILRLDGAEISGTTADAQGNFAVLFVLDPSTAPRMLTLGSIVPGQQEITALGEVALAPTTAAAVVAAVEPVPATSETASAETAPAESPTDAAVAPALMAEAPAALLVTKDGVNVLQSGSDAVTADAQTDLAIDTISYTPSGEVQLAGRAGAGAVLRVYLDNAPLIDVAVGDDGRWASTMPMIAPGIYTLRVDALAADGSVTARFETPFKRETQDALAAATQSESPENPTVVAEPPPEPEGAAVPVAETAAPATPPVDPPADLPAETAQTALASAPDAPAEPAQDAQPAAATPVSITVQPGFTLWGIASEQFGDGVLYVQVFEANKDKIRDPNLIYPGQVFVIPAGSE